MERKAKQTERPEQPGKSKNKILAVAAVLVAVAVTAVAGALEYFGFFESAEQKEAFVSSAFEEIYANAGLRGTQAEASAFSVHFIDVGQGDCELIISGSACMLIDAGENGNEATVIDYLHNLGITRLDYVVATHPHSDHIGALDSVINAFEVGNVIMPRLTEENTPSNATYTNFLTAVKNSGARTIAAKAGKTYNLGEAVITVLGPIYQDEELNNMSVVLRTDYGDTSFLFEGDAEKREENDILDSGADVDCDVLKVGHHCSKTSSGEAYLAAASPKTAVISCGEGNDYGHPHNAALKRIKRHTTDIYRTDLCSTVVITSDGENYEVSYKEAA